MATGELASAPAHEKVYQQLRELVLFGDFYPGRAVTLQGVADQLSVSLTPVREAVRRLITERALEFHGNRRISVPVPDAQRLEEIYAARKIIELDLTERAILSITESEIDELERVDALMDDAIRVGDVQTYLRTNYAFHFGLFRASNSQVLLPIAEGLWLQLGPCLRVACGRFGTSNLMDEHKRIVAGLRVRDHHMVMEAMRADIEQGYNFVREELLLS